MEFNTLDLATFGFILLTCVFTWGNRISSQAASLFKWAGIFISPFYIFLIVSPAISAYISGEVLYRIISILVSFLLGLIVFHYSAKIWISKGSDINVGNELLIKILASILGGIRMLLLLFVFWLPINTFWQGDSYPAILNYSQTEKLFYHMSNGIRFILPNQWTPQEYIERGYLLLSNNYSSTLDQALENIEIKIKPGNIDIRSENT